MNELIGTQRPTTTGRVEMGVHGVLPIGIQRCCFDLTVAAAALAQMHSRFVLDVEGCLYVLGCLSSVGLKRPH